jgi:N utilization substance protein B
LPKKTYTVQNRRRARELAVQLLYSLDAHPGRNMDDCVNAFVSEEGFAFGENAEVKAYLRFLAEGVWNKRHDIDNKMRAILTGWRPERMVAVDRAVLRVAIFEGFLESRVPIAVAISEAVEVARFFGAEESGRFVNGVLGKMARFAADAKAADANGKKTDANRNNFQNRDDNMDDDNAASTSQIPIDR